MSRLYGGLEERQSEGEELRMPELEVSFRDAALACGRQALSKFLSEMPESAPLCPDCGSPMRNLGSRGKQIVTLLGECEFSRNYYGCDCASDCSEGRGDNNHAVPKDEKLGVSGTRFTEAVKRVTAQVASSDSFRDTSANLRMLCGIDVSAKDAERIAENIGAEIIGIKQCEIAYSEAEMNPPEPETPAKILYIEYDGTGIPVRKNELAGIKGKQPDGTAKTREMKTGCIFTQSGTDKEGRPVRDTAGATYFSQIAAAEDFGRLVYSEAVKRGVDYAENVVVLGDGAKWIWTIAGDYFPSATQIIDLYHAKEHVSDLLRALIPDNGEMQEKKKELYELLENGNIDELAKSFSDLSTTTEEQREKVRVEYNCFIQNKHRMQYQEFSKRDLFVGSGVIEAACKHVIGKRLKQSGMRWSVSGANEIAALRCSVLSGDFEPKQT